MSRTRGGAIVLAALVLLILSCGCGASSDSDSESWSPDTDPVSLPGGAPEFAGARLTWAQGRALHYGDRTFEVGRGPIRGLVRTPYGFFLRLDEEGHDVVFLDGSGTTRLPGVIGSLGVSPDGRYAGWMDLGAGESEVATVRIVDLVTGRQVFATRKGMGASTDDLVDLYEDAQPAFYGFDEHHAYWYSAVGDSAQVVLDLRTWQTRPGRLSADALGPIDTKVIYRSNIGWSIPVFPDRTQRTRGGTVGYLSPDRAYVVTTGTTGKVFIDRAVAGTRAERDATPAFDRRDQQFAGWVDADEDRFAVLAGRFPRNYYLEAPDRTTGVMLSCVPDGPCAELHAVARTRSLVFDTGLFPDQQ